MAQVTEMTSEPAPPSDSGGKRGGTIFLVVVVGIAVLLAILWASTQKNYTAARQRLEGSDGRIAAADRARKQAEEALKTREADFKLSDEKIAAARKDVDAARKDLADIKAERDRIATELVQAKKDSESFQTRIAELEAGAGKPKPEEPGVIPTPKAPAPEDPKKPGGQ